MAERSIAGPKSSSSRCTPAERIWRSLAAMPVFSSSRITDLRFRATTSAAAAFRFERVEEEFVEVDLAQLGAGDVDGKAPKLDSRPVPFASSGIALAITMRPISAIRPTFRRPG